VEEADASFVYPSDPRDGWEPGAPSVRAIAPSAIGGAIVPLGVYFAVRHQVHGDAAALMIAGIPATAWVTFSWLRHRQLDPIGAIVLAGFIAGVSASYAMGGNAFVLKVRDSAFTCLFGIACLVSVRIRQRPIMFYLGRTLSAGDDPIRAATYDQLWDMPPARATFRIITTMWGFGLILDAATRVLLALALPTGVFLVVSPATAAVWIGGMFFFTVVLTRWSRDQTKWAAEPVPVGGDATWWWTRHYLRFYGRTAWGRVTGRRQPDARPDTTS
jgi:hypothetical protein